MSVFNQLVSAWKITKVPTSLEWETVCFLLKKNMIIYNFQTGTQRIIFCIFCSLRIAPSLCVPT